MSPLTRLNLVFTEIIVSMAEIENPLVTRFQFSNVIVLSGVSDSCVLDSGLSNTDSTFARFSVLL